jgi:probable rRNA maturation factor
VSGPEASDPTGSEKVRVTRAVEVSELSDEDARAAVGAALSHGGRPGLRIDVVFVDDPTLQAMHEEFLDDPSVTDVMAFDYTQADGDADPEAEVYVSADRARAVATERGESPRDELLLYLVHGALHLCGMDDHEEGPREEMRAAETAVLSKLR